MTKENNLDYISANDDLTTDNVLQISVVKFVTHYLNWMKN